MPEWLEIIINLFLQEGLSSEMLRGIGRAMGFIKLYGVGLLQKAELSKQLIAEQYILHPGLP